MVEKLLNTVSLKVLHKYLSTVINNDCFTRQLELEQGRTSIEDRVMSSICETIFKIYIIVLA